MKHLVVVLSIGVLACFVFLSLSYPKETSSPCDPKNPDACFYPIEDRYQVQSTLFWFQDSSRIGGPREIPIVIYEPDTLGKFPVIIASHGGAKGKRNALSSLPNWSRQLAAQGYVVVAIAHTPRNIPARKTLCDSLGMTTAECKFFKHLNWDRPLDVGHVLDSLELWNTYAPWRDRMDLDHVGHVGHSAGAGCGMMLAGAKRMYHNQFLAFRESRIHAVGAFSPQGPGEEGFVDSSFLSIETPILFGTGDGDNTSGSQALVRRQAFSKSAPSGDKYIHYIMDAKADHGTYSLNSDKCAKKKDPLQCQAYIDWTFMSGLAFFDAYLKGDQDAMDWLTNKNIETATADVVELRAK
ncbi:MAG: hypothetical protein AAFV80_10800 [Bacteroidota bacterium]